MPKEKPTYSELLRDPRWQKLRLQVMEGDGWQCKLCGDDGTTLNVHHRWYEKGRKPWEYEPPELLTLCRPCHDELTQAREMIKYDLGYLSPDELYAWMRLISLVQGHGSGVSDVEMLYSQFCAINKDAQLFVAEQLKQPGKAYRFDEAVH